MANAIKLVVYVLEALFTVGIIGSALVILLTSIEDSEVFFSKDREATAAAVQPPSSPEE